MRRVIVHASMLLAVVALGVKALRAESSFYQRFKAAANDWGFIQDSSLMDTNNSGPILTNAPVSYAGFTTRGELAGIKLGMTMSEVVALWGKPRQLYMHCVIGPRFWYGSDDFGDFDLSFSGDRLVLIAITQTTAEQVAFDNGLTGTMSRLDCERLLGAPVPRDPGLRCSLHNGEIAYRAGEVRTDLVFNHISAHGTSGPTERIISIAVCLEREAVNHPFVEPDGATNGSQPIRSETNRTSPATGSRR